MAQWVLSVAGIAILSVLADVILPDGQTRKYIKTVIGIVVTLVLVQPIISLSVTESINFSDSVQVQPQQQYLSYVEDMQSEEVELLRSKLLAAGFVNPNITYTVKSRQYLVNFTERYSENLYGKANSAVASANCKYAVKFCWNNTESI